MIEMFAEFFRQVAEDYPRWNFIFFHDPRQWARVVSTRRLVDDDSPLGR